MGSFFGSETSSVPFAWTSFLFLFRGSVQAALCLETLFELGLGQNPLETARQKQCAFLGSICSVTLVRIII